MSSEQATTEKRNVPILAGQGAFNVMAWSMASPAIVLTFLAVSLDLPIFLAGLLVSIRHGAGMLTDVIGSKAISRISDTKRVIVYTDLAIAACFLFVILITLQGNRGATIVAFIIAIFLIGVLAEIKSLLIIDFISDNMNRHNRMNVSYVQKAIGGAGTITLVLVAHQIMLDEPALSRHSTVVFIGVLCFVLSAVSMLAFREKSNDRNEVPEPHLLKKRMLSDFISGVRSLSAEPWFRKYMLIRLSFVVVGLSVPFFALLAAEAHHTSAKGLTALVVSSAAAVLIAAPLWRLLNGYSSRLVMIVGTLLVMITGTGIIAIHFGGFDHEVHLHAAALFLVTVAVTGIGGARSLYFMEVAPKEQRIAAQAVSTSLARIAVIAISAALAAIAHSGEVVWAVAIITTFSLIATIISFQLVPPTGTDRKAGRESADLKRT